LNPPPNMSSSEFSRLATLPVVPDPTCGSVKLDTADKDRCANLDFSAHVQPLCRHYLGAGKGYCVRPARLMNADSEGVTFALLCTTHDAEYLREQSRKKIEAAQKLDKAAKTRQEVEQVEADVAAETEDAPKKRAKRKRDTQDGGAKKKATKGGKATKVEEEAAAQETDGAQGDDF